MIVSDVPGTTRDAIDTQIQTEEGLFDLIDTAGIRRPGKRAVSYTHLTLPTKCSV